MNQKVLLASSEPMDEKDIVQNVHSPSAEPKDERYMYHKET